MQIHLEEGQGQGQAAHPFSVPVPFLREETGLGEAISRFTQALGIKPCSPCQQRAEALDRRVVFSPWAT